MWRAKSKLELFSLTMNSENCDDTTKELIKRIKNDYSFPINIKNAWIKKLEKIKDYKEEEEKEDAINRVLKSIYDYGDENRIWVS